LLSEDQVVAAMAVNAVREPHNIEGLAIKPQLQTSSEFSNYTATLSPGRQDELTAMEHCAKKLSLDIPALPGDANVASFLGRSTRAGRRQDTHLLQGALCFS